MAQRKRDYYEVLGVPRSADAAELKRAYRSLAMRYHPDQNQNDKGAEEKFKEVSEAYAILSDTDKRLRYDRLGHLGLGAGMADLPMNLDLEGFKDLFDNLFGDLLGRKKGRASGRDLRYTVEVTLEEAALGIRKLIRFPSTAECGECGGTGGKGPAGLRTCEVCGGKGDLKAQPGFFSLSKTCTVCHGSGKIVVTPCERCGGKGQANITREFEVSIPAGTEEGGVRRVAGQGEPGRRGGPAGDLQVIVRIKEHPLLKRDGQVIACEVPITYAQAALGCSVLVPTLDGKVEMKVPPGTASGTVFRLRGRGFPLGLSSPKRGDVHVKVVVETPRDLSVQQQELLQELSRATPPESQPLQQKFLDRMREHYG